MKLSLKLYKDYYEFVSIWIRRRLGPVTRSAFKRYKANYGFLLAGVVLTGVSYNVYYEVYKYNKVYAQKENTCQYISTQ